MTSKTGSVMIHFLLISFLFPVFTSFWDINYISAISQYPHSWTLKDDDFKNRIFTNSFPFNFLFLLR